ncbi:MAG: hypothetical protein EH225_05455 [Calditrichaeota bacterium]|nr:hypothetical protein [Calditrichota bacterium]RQW04742.1 MAG: hypothetical protein EH225_05455 [Calditrichota bacterium]
MKLEYNIYGKLLVFIFSFLVVFSCERAGPVEQEPPSQATFNNIQTSIFNQSCALSNCHAGSSAPFGLDLSAESSYNNLVNVASQEVPSLLRVDPGEPDSSYLVLKVEGASGIIGQRMPIGGNPLSAEQINLIREWINNGAPNN